MYFFHFSKWGWVSFHKVKNRVHVSYDCLFISLASFLIGLWVSSLFWKQVNHFSQNRFQPSNHITFHTMCFLKSGDQHYIFQIQPYYIKHERRNTGLEPSTIFLSIKKTKSVPYMSSHCWEWRFSLPVSLLHPTDFPPYPQLNSDMTIHISP